MKFNISIDKHLVDVNSTTPTKVIVETVPIKVEIENQITNINTEIETNKINVEVKPEPTVINAEINISKIVVEVGASIGIGSNITPVWGGIVGDINNQTDLINELDAKENSLGNPTVDDYVLSSKIDGTRSWVEQSGGSGGSSVWGEITGDITNQEDLVEYIEDNTPDAIITTDIISTVDVGAIVQAQTIAEGTTLTQFVQALLMQTYYPTYVAPTATLAINISNSVECGYQQAATLTVTFNRGQIKGLVVAGVWDANAFQNHRSGAIDYYLIDGTNTGTTNTKSLGTYTVTEGTNTFSSTSYYLIGPQPLDSLGNNFEVPLAAGSIVATKLIYGRRNLFYGTSASDVSNSAGVRALSGTTLNPANGTTFTINIPVGAVNVCFAYPATLRDITSVKYVEGLNAEIKGVFTKSTFNVEGANGYSATSYKVYVYTPVEPFGATATYNCTI